MSVHLHVRSAYTLLNSTLSIPKIIALAKEYSYTSVALCDRWVMHGAPSFYKLATDANIKPIFGMEVDCVVQDEQIMNFVVLAKNDLGYQNLLQLSTDYQIQQKLFSLEELSLYCKECIVISAKENDIFYQSLITSNFTLVEKCLQLCHKIFSNFYVGIVCNDSGLMNRNNETLKKLCKNLNIPTVALSLIFYGTQEEEEHYRVLCAIDQGVTIEDKTLSVSGKRFFRTKQEMMELYADEDLKMSDYIASQCNVKMQIPKVSLPKFQNKLGISSEEYLKKLCYKGLQKRMDFQTVPTVYIERLNYELQIIIQMQYADYFLIVWDFIRFARSRHIYVGPGRGSAAGSLVSYCLGITHVDPIYYGLLFERFLNPERISMPDIDTDFPDNRRDEVIEYVEKLYGKEHVAHIITFNTLGAKQVLRDVGRVLRISNHDINLLCKLIPNIPKVTLDYAYKNSSKFAQMITSSTSLKHLFQIAHALEGLPRHTSLHAAGIVFSNQPISTVCPLMKIDAERYVTQFTMEYLEQFGLIKMDFLGLRNLTIIDDIVNQINQQQPLDIMKIPLDDPKTYELLCKVDTVGVFQLESEGIQSLIKKMQPQTFEDIVAIIALFRPGPMEYIPEYIKRKEHHENIEYVHEDVKPILKHTYGIMIYQEQISATRCI